MNQLLPVVVDASVAIKWVIAEEFSDKADALYEAAASSNRPIFAPPHFGSEVVNALYQRTRRGEEEKRISESRAEQAVAKFLSLGVELLSPSDLYHEAFVLARAHRYSSIYDALYVVLSQMLSTDLWTADLALLRRVAPTSPLVRWIGDYEAPMAP